MEPKTFKMELTREQAAWVISEDEIREEHEQLVRAVENDKLNRERAIIDIAKALGYTPIKEGERPEKLNVGFYGWIVHEGEFYIIQDIIDLAQSNDAKV